MKKELYMLAIKKNRIELEWFTLNLKYNLGIKSHAEIKFDSLKENSIIPNEDNTYIIK